MERPEIAKRTKRPLLAKNATSHLPFVGLSNSNCHQHRLHRKLDELTARHVYYIGNTQGRSDGDLDARNCKAFAHLC